MAGFVEAVRILIIPALVASFLYILLAYLVVPLLRRHRERYNQYAPLDTIRSSTSAVRSRMLSGVIDVLLLVFRRRRRAVEVHEGDQHRDSLDGDELAFGEEEGESMVGFDVARRDRSVRGANVDIPSDNRLSRDLEAGFKDDDSEEEVVYDRRNT